MNDVLDELRTIVADRSRGIPDDDFTLRALWSVDYRSRPTQYERYMAYSFVLAQAAHQGCCYTDPGAAVIKPESESLIGQDAREARGITYEEDIAILDAAFGSLPQRPDHVRVVDGPLAVKALARARIIVNEALRLLAAAGGRRVVNVGVMGNLIHQLRGADVDISASDFDPDLREHGILGVPVESGHESPRLVAESDVALICGETLPSRTLDTLLTAARENGTKVIVFAVSGCYFAEEYCRTFGADVVVSEPQPQYLFQGPSTLGIFRRDSLTPREAR